MISVDKYLSRRYNAKSYNCLHFVCEIWEDLTGTSITPYLTPVLVPGERLLTSKVLKPFTRIPVPANPSLVFMRRRPFAPHIGIYVDGRVLHLLESGAQFQLLDVATEHYTDVRFYVCR
jgi:hypothetical protein